MSPLTPVGNALVLAWPGPSRPTVAEVECTRRLELSHYSTADFAVLNVASRLCLGHAAWMYNPGQSIDPSFLEPPRDRTVQVPYAVPGNNNEDLDICVENLATLASQFKETYNPKLTLVIGREFRALVDLLSIEKSYSFDSINIHFGNQYMIIENQRL